MAGDVDGTARIFRANIFEPGTSNLVSGFQQDQVWHDGMNSQDIESRGGLLRLEYDFGAVTLTSITGYETLEMYSRGDIDGGYGAAFLPDWIGARLHPLCLGVGRRPAGSRSAHSGDPCCE